MLIFYFYSAWNYQIFPGFDVLGDVEIEYWLKILHTRVIGNLI